MNINYKLSNDDYLEYQMYTSYKSNLQRKKRFRSRIIIPIFYLILGVFIFIRFGHIKSEITISVIFILISVLWFLFYPAYLKWRCKRYFRKYIQENYQNMINIDFTMIFERDIILTKDLVSEGKINASEIKELIELPNHFFIKLATNASFVIPKFYIQDQIELKKVIENYGAVYVNELNWNWR